MSADEYFALRMANRAAANNLKWEFHLHLPLSGKQAIMGTGYSSADAVFGKRRTAL